eukprot:4150169-Pyramimonas_sp.AAC.1
MREFRRRHQRHSPHGAPAPDLAHPSQVSWQYWESHRRPKRHSPHGVSAPDAAHPSVVQWPTEGPSGT